MEQNKPVGGRKLLGARLYFGLRKPNLCFGGRRMPLALNHKGNSLRAAAWQHSLDMARPLQHRAS